MLLMVCFTICVEVIAYFFTHIRTMDVHGIIESDPDMQWAVANIANIRLKHRKEYVAINNRAIVDEDDDLDQLADRIDATTCILQVIVHDIQTTNSLSFRSEKLNSCIARAQPHPQVIKRSTCGLFSPTLPALVREE